MRGRSLALAVVPVLLLGQCAPQCTPLPPPPAPSPPETRPPPVAGWIRRTRDVTPADQSLAMVDGMSRDGARLDLDLIATTGRLDVATGRLDVLPFRGELTEDGGAVIGVTGVGEDAVVARHDIATGVVAIYPALPPVWEIAGGVAIDDAGRHIGVVGSNGALADLGVFSFDQATGAWTRPDEPLGVDGTYNQSVGQRFSSDGSVDVFEYVSSPEGCDGYCTGIWRSGRAGLTIVNPGIASTTPTNGDSWLLDVSPDGRFVLFGSTSTDLGGIGGWADGRVYVRDTAAGTTVVVAQPADPRVGSISDDGQIIAFADDDGVPRVAIGVGTPAWRSIPAAPTLASDDHLHPYSSVQIDGRGTVVAYTTLGGRVLVSDFVDTGR